MTQSTLTICFESPFWVGIYERVDGDRYEVCKILEQREAEKERQFALRQQKKREKHRGH